MSEKKNIATFTGVDIEKYHRGQLSSKEMHALEKAALEDPFLADALEGYSATGVNAADDLADLSHRISQRLEEKEQAPIVPIGKKTNLWWRIAAMFVLIAGAAWIVYLTGGTGNKSEIAQVTKPTHTTTPSIKEEAASSHRDTAISTFKQEDKKGKAADERIASEITTQHTTTKEHIISSKKDDAKSVLPGNPPTATAPARNVAEEEVIVKKQVPESSTSTADMTLSKKEEVAKLDNNYRQQKADVQQEDRRAFAQNRLRQQSTSQVNVFRGQITDTKNNALPFASITNQGDNVGTYSDANGYFILTSPDTTLQVQVRSVGFENNDLQLRNTLVNNQVVLMPDQNVKEILIGRSQANSSRSRSSTMVLEEPEPADGWVKYDTYLANNLNVPESYQQRSVQTNNEVELSFEVDKLGNPINFKVEKSLCNSCDKEAIRLIKEGPKWKPKKKKNSRTRVVVPFE